MKGNELIGVGNRRRNGPMSPRESIRMARMQRTDSAHSSSTSSLHTYRSTRPAKGSTVDIRKRMDDVFAQMERESHERRLHLPVKFVALQEADILFQFVRTAIGYALAFLKVQSLRQKMQKRKSDETAMILRPDSPTLPSQLSAKDEQFKQIEQANETHSQCASRLAAAYARLVLHCSNYENQKEDEHFFECVYFFVCSVVKLSVPPDHWNEIEEELGYLFRSQRYSSNVKTHTARSQKEANAAAQAAAQALEASHSTNATQKIQNLTAQDTKSVILATNDSQFRLPKFGTVSFSEAVPVRKIISEVDATKNRAVNNIRIAQSIRERVAKERHEAVKRQMEAIVSPRRTICFEDDTLQVHPNKSNRQMAKPISWSRHGNLSPRRPVGNNLNARSPAVNQLLPGREDRVRAALGSYERDFRRKLALQRGHSSPVGGRTATALERILENHSSSASSMMSAPSRR